MIKKRFPLEKKLLYFVTEDWYFLSHRLELAKSAMRDGYKVILVTNITGREEEIRQAEIELIPLKIRRRSLNPFHLIITIGKVAQIYRQVNPLLIHHVAMFPVIVGGIAARIVGLRRIVNTLPGIGYVFTSIEVKARIICPFFRSILRKLLRRSEQMLIVQNDDDRNWAICEIGTKSENVRLIKGSGVDMGYYKPGHEVDEPPVVIMASRLIWDKGVGEFVEAARELQSRGFSAKFVLAGGCDEGNPNSVSRVQLETWEREGVIEWLGYQRDMPTVLARCHIVCLPTAYGEGIPKILIEAAACALPIVATDIAGCRAVVTHGANGFLIPVKSSHALVNALISLLQDPELRLRMGKAGRQLVETEFSLGKVNQETMSVYHQVLVKAGMPHNTHTDQA